VELVTVSAVRIPASVRGPGLKGTVFDLTVADGTITAVTPCPEGTVPTGTVLPGLVDLHLHLDKTYTVAETGPSYGDLFRAIGLMAQHQSGWTAPDLERRMTRALGEAWQAGTRALRTHLDWPVVRPIAIDVFLKLRGVWKDRLAMEWVSLTALDKFDDPAFGREVARQVKEGGGILGCFVYRNENLRTRLEGFFALAVEFGLDLDFHVDEGLDADARGLEIIAELTQASKWNGRVTCGHVCSLSVQPQTEALMTLDAVAKAGIHLVSLPTTNLFLQGSWTDTPVPRGITRLLEARRAGVPLSLANDNVADPFFPYGTYDLLEAWCLGVQMAHMAPSEDWLDTVTTAPAQAMKLAWDGRIAAGSPADFMLLEAVDEWALMTPSGRRRRVCRQGSWL
jgi:cytosine deaminase